MPVRPDPVQRQIERDAVELLVVELGRLLGAELAADPVHLRQPVSQSSSVSFTSR